MRRRTAGGGIKSRDVQQILLATDQPGQANPNVLSPKRLCSEEIRDGLDRLRNGGYRRELEQPQLGNDGMIPLRRHRPLCAVASLMARTRTPAAALADLDRRLHPPGHPPIGFPAATDIDYAVLAALHTGIINNFGAIPSDVAANRGTRNASRERLWLS